MKMLVLFEKTPRLRFIGHLDLMRTMQRALRRSNLPLRYSQGFNPHILLGFAAPLSLGQSGKEEIMEVPLEGNVSVEEFSQKIKNALPQDLRLIEVIPVEDTHPSLMSLMWCAEYEITPLEHADAITAAIPEFLKQKEIQALRKTKSGEKMCDIRPMIEELHADGTTIHALLALRDEATCKAELLMKAMCSYAGMDVPRLQIIRVRLWGRKEGQLVPLKQL